MTLLDDEDKFLAQFLELVVLSEASDKEEKNMEEPKAKRKRVKEDESAKQSVGSSFVPKNIGVNNGVVPRRIETGYFGKIPPKLFHHILKFLSFEVKRNIDLGYGGGSVGLMGLISQRVYD